MITYKGHSDILILLCFNCMLHYLLAHREDHRTVTIWLLHVVIHYLMQQACFSDSRSTQKCNLKLKIFRDVLQLHLCSVIFDII